MCEKVQLNFRKKQGKLTFLLKSGCGKMHTILTKILTLLKRGLDTQTSYQPLPEPEYW